MMKTVDFVALLKNYKSGWVAISSDFTKVVLSGKTLKEVQEKAQGIKELRIGLEATGLYWWHLACFLKETRMELFRIVKASAIYITLLSASMHSWPCVTKDQSPQ